MSRAKVVVVVAVMLAMSGCGSPAEPVPTVTETVIVTETVEVTVTPTPEPVPDPTLEPDTGSSALDRTAEVQAIAGDAVVRAEEDAPGQFTVWTSIVDPRGGDGSPQAQAALAICNAVVQEFGATHVRVQEADESTFVVTGGAAYASCTEV